MEKSVVLFVCLPQIDNSVLLTLIRYYVINVEKVKNIIKRIQK